MFQNDYYVYITTNKEGGTLYVGVTNNLEGRIWEHKEGAYKSFTNKYKANMLVYYEVYEVYNDIKEAITREKQLKTWNRQWKINLIEKENPEWKDLYYDLQELDPRFTDDPSDGGHQCSGMTNKT